MRRRISGDLGVDKFPYKKIWQIDLVPPKVAFFPWASLRGGVLTVDKIKKRGLIVVNRCYLCKKDEENVEHLFCSCEVARRVWKFFFSSFGLQIGRDVELWDSLNLLAPTGLSVVGCRY